MSSKASKQSRSTKLHFTPEEIILQVKFQELQMLLQSVSSNNDTGKKLSKISALEALAVATQKVRAAGVRFYPHSSFSFITLYMLYNFWLYSRKESMMIADLSLSHTHTHTLSLSLSLLTHPIPNILCINNTQPFIIFIYFCYIEFLGHSQTRRK